MENGKLVSEVVKWYIVNENLTWLCGDSAHGAGETDLLNFAGNLSIELGKIGQQCGAMLQKMDLSDVVLLLGAGGVIAYLWKNSIQEYEYCKSRLGERNIMSWLFDKQDESANIRPSNIKSNIQDEFLPKESDGVDNLGLNVLSSREQKRRFLQHRLFDINQLRNTSRFKLGFKSKTTCEKSCPSENHINMCNEQITNNVKPQYKTSINDIESETDESNCSQNVLSLDSNKCTLSKTRYLPTAELYGSIARGTPDGQERCTSSPETENLISMKLGEKFLLTRAAVNPNAFPISDSMVEIMQNAKEVRRLIRETSLDSQASDFCFDIPAREGNCEKEQIIQVCQFEREESLPPLSLPQFDNREMFKLVGFYDRESSIFSEYSDHWRDEKPYKVVLGHSSNMSEIGDDIGSISGSCLDQWEWDDECYYEGDFKCGKYDEQQDQHGARITDIKELDLESELRLRDSSIFSSAYSFKEPSITSEYQLLCRLPPSGRSSVQSLNESIQI